MSFENNAKSKSAEEREEEEKLTTDFEVAKSDKKTKEIQESDSLTRRINNLDCSSQSQLDGNLSQTQTCSDSTPGISSYKEIRIYGNKEFLREKDILPDNFWDVGFQDLKLYEDLINGCNGF